LAPQIGRRIYEDVLFSAYEHRTARPFELRLRAASDRPRSCEEDGTPSGAVENVRYAPAELVRPFSRTLTELFASSLVQFFWRAGRRNGRGPSAGLGEAPSARGATLG
jgi:hypothetical protein